LAGAIADPDKAYRDFHEYVEAVDREGSIAVIRRSVSPEDFSLRFSQFLNTYWIYLIGWKLTSGSAEAFGDSNFTQDATAELITTEYYVSCHVAWLTAFTIATIIALFCSIASLALVVQLRGPKLAWDLSTAVRYNPHVAGSDCASYLDDDERSRVMSQTRVVLGDIAPGREVGHVAVSSLRTGEKVGERRLKIGRFYA
jgi:hypothetical protein